MVYKVTMRSFLQNPTGWGSASVARRDIIRKDLEKRYFVLYKLAKDKFSLKVYLDKAGNYYYYFKIPSEYYYNQRLAYDVVLKFDKPANHHRNDYTLASYQMSMFSNSPNFMFTYAYVYNKDGNLIPFLNRKLPRTALTEKPKVRNPNLQHGFEKSVYFAVLYIREHPRLMQKAMLHPEKLVIQNFLSHISTSKDKLKEYNQAKETYRNLSGAKKTIQKIATLSERGLYNKRLRDTTKHKFSKVAPTPAKKTKVLKRTFGNEVAVNHGKKIDMKVNMKRPIRNIKKK